MPHPPNIPPSGEHKGWHSRGYLPHFDSPGSVQHIVCRVIDSIPAHLLNEMRGDAAARRTKVDQYLDLLDGPRPLAAPEMASIVQRDLLFEDGARYRLIGWCIMPNHIHVLVDPLDGHPLGAIVRSWKMASTRKINLLLASSGQFWAPDYFDRYMRNEAHLAQTLAYIENNPVKAGLVKAPQDWPFSSCRWRMTPKPDRAPPGAQV